MTKFAAFSDDTSAWGLIEGDALIALAQLPDASIDAIVTDPPYGIDFAGESWDGAAIRREAKGLSNPDAFERWSRVWATEARRVLKPGGHLLAFGAPRMFHRLVTGVERAELEVRDQLLWLYAQGLPKSRRLPYGLGTTLKPAYEPILLARRPFSGGVTGNLERFGTGALNIETTAVGHDGYWPAQIVLSHADNCSDQGCAAECPVRQLDRAPATRPLSRLFFCAKATRTEREAGCEELPARSQRLYNGRHHPPRVRRNTHRTVKPLELMRWLVRLVTPPGGLVLDPFCGSGSTGAAAALEGRRFLGVEREAVYVDIACARLTHWASQAKGER
jgi:DNA modification methylase